MTFTKALIATAITASLTGCLGGTDATDSPLKVSGLKKLGQYDSESEIVSFNKSLRYMYFIGGDNALSIVDISAPDASNEIAKIDLSSYGAGAQSVTATDTAVAVAVAPANKSTEKGKVIFFDAAGTFVQSVEVGYLPDMITFTADGSKVLVANEGEPSGDYANDPAGTVGVINVSDYSYTDIALDGTLTAAADGTAVRLGGTPSSDQNKDLEPEYIAVEGDFAFVSLQENNAIAKVDLRDNSVALIKSLGAKSYATDSGNTIDIEEEGEINMKAFDGLFGLYMPDTIASATINGNTYLFSANEGDGREYIYDTDQTTCEAAGHDFDDEDGCFSFVDEKKISKLDLDDSIASNFETDNDLKVVTDLGDTDGDGDYDQLYTYGARSFSIWDDNIELVYDSGDGISKAIIEFDAANFNQDDGEIDGRSGNKGGEPEALAVGEIDGRYYAFVGLERQSAIMTFDVTDPTAPTFVQYLNTGAENNLSPEGMKFVAADESPTSKPLLLVAYEYGTDTAPQAAVIYEVTTE
ncbi:MAG: collagen-like protein [Gammaproteobacteria bacterium]|nr:collagen-like protein [Gammaproteobacteria bacterium]